MLLDGAGAHPAPLRTLMAAIYLWTASCEFASYLRIEERELEAC